MRAREERGAALLIALIFVVVFASGLAVLLDFENISFRLTSSVHTKKSLQYAAEATLEAAIDNVRTQAVGFSDVACPSFTLSGPSAVNGTDIRVDCSGTGLAKDWLSSRTRTITFNACQASNLTPNCPGQVIVTATVKVVDSPLVGQSVAASSWTNA
jgi:Tfp pilus assembly protein PilX